MKVNSINKSNKIATMTVSDEVFGAVVNNNLLSQAIRVYLSNKRQGTSKTKTRSEVARTGKKWFKQKGTGNARHAARSAPIFVGGGMAHGPKGIENWDLTLSKKMRKGALISALSAQSANIFVAEDINSVEAKTKNAQALIDNAKLSDKRVLLVLDKDADRARLAFRNIANVEIVEDSLLNTLDVATVQAVIFSKDALANVEARLAKKEEKVK